MTTHRIAILEFMADNHSHPSAEDIYSALHQKFDSMSKMTVYNNLQTLVSSKLLQEIDIDKEKARYDCITATHHHFYCNVCKKIYDVALECPNLNHETMDGHAIESVQGYFFGTCRECRAG
ncbi:MAG: transcriptional repressor [Spirochaetes bacterium]|nr:transcriptional repressor [Spirochaetota bacterium]